MYGGTGADILRGGSGADTMAGGAGLDVFVFGKTSDSGTTAGGIDTINFFTVGAGFINRIDLSEIDAIASTAGNDAFTFIEGRAFTAEGQVRIQQSGSATYITLNTSGTGGADMKICLTNFDGGLLVSGDFIL